MEKLLSELKFCLDGIAIPYGQNLTIASDAKTSMLQLKLEIKGESKYKQIDPKVFDVAETQETGRKGLLKGCYKELLEEFKNNVP